MNDQTPINQSPDKETLDDLYLLSGLASAIDGLLWEADNVPGLNGSMAAARSAKRISDEAIDRLETSRKADSTTGEAP